MRALAIGAVVVGGILLALRSQQAQATADAGSAVDTMTGWGEQVMSTVNNAFIDVPGAVGNPNVQAFLTAIRTGEGTADADGYARLFGYRSGRQIHSFADHPRVSHPFGITSTTAAGAYQFLARTWDEMAAKYSLPDFSPQSQDIAAVGLIKRRGALADVIAGKFAAAIEKCNKEWASLPGSPYGQPTRSMAQALATIQNNGGVMA